MITNLLRFALIGGSLAGVFLIYSLFVRLMTGVSIPALLLLLVVAGIYSYGAATFMSVKGIRFFTRME